MTAYDEPINSVLLKSLVAIERYCEKHGATYALGTVHPMLRYRRGKYQCQIARGDLLYASYDLTEIAYADTKEAAIQRVLTAVQSAQAATDNTTDRSN